MQPAKKPISNEARAMANIFMWAIVIFFLGSGLGIWVKLFWLNWVLGGCL